MITLNYSNYLKKQKEELIGCDDQPCSRFKGEDLAIHLIMDSRTISSVEFKSKLGFKIKIQ